MAGTEDHLLELKSARSGDKFIIAGDADLILKNARQFNQDGNNLPVYRRVKISALKNKENQELIGNQIAVVRLSNGRMYFFFQN